MAPPLDCVIVGAGPAGLTAAIYLARFHLRVALLDGGPSRAALIPRTRNLPGWPGGIGGEALLARMRAQAAEFGIAPVAARAERLARDRQGLAVHAGPAAWSARAVLLATGVVNRRPAMDPAAHDVALARGLLRYCPVCDGYEVTDRAVGVIGTGRHGADEALFLRSYTADLALIAPDGRHRLRPADRARLAAAGVRLVDGPCGPLRLDGESLAVPVPGAVERFASVYPALGSEVRGELALALGAGAGADGGLRVDAHQRTTVPGLYAAGDVTLGLDQISRAMGEAAQAATAIRNDLAAQSRLWRG
ncbi:MAG: NAD(P)/FAD-dependent oxidoreductase [Sphingomonadales bacterium]|nr:NAD(P)/FAD-dependent oxidoreductase [Sphingomonadales bacterium]